MIVAALSHGPNSEVLEVPFRGRLLRRVGRKQYGEPALLPAHLQILELSTEVPCRSGQASEIILKRKRAIHGVVSKTLRRPQRDIVAVMQTQERLVARSSLSVDDQPRASAGGLSAVPAMSAKVSSSRSQDGTVDTRSSMNDVRLFESEEVSTNSMTPQMRVDVVRLGRRGTPTHFRRFSMASRTSSTRVRKPPRSATTASSIRLISGTGNGTLAMRCSISDVSFAMSRNMATIHLVKLVADISVVARYTSALRRLTSGLCTRLGTGPRP